MEILCCHHNDGRTNPLQNTHQNQNSNQIKIPITNQTLVTRLVKSYGFVHAYEQVSD
jgi:hypothetical protein